jgi:hypothetical protein
VPIESGARRTELTTQRSIAQCASDKMFGPAALAKGSVWPSAGSVGGLLGIEGCGASTALGLTWFHGCINIEYMAKSAVMTLRLAPELLSELRARARTEGRSTSSEVIHLIQRVIGVPKARGAARRSTMGMFAHLEAPELADFQSDGHANARVFEEAIATSIKLYHSSDTGPTVTPVPAKAPVRSKNRARQTKSR